MKGLNKIIFLFCSVVLFSCKNETKKTNNSEIKDRCFQLEKRGWKSLAYNQLVDDINFTAIEVPIQYYLLKDKGNQDLVQVDSLYETNKTERVIEFTFTQDEEKDLLSEDFTKLSYTDGVKYMSFGLDKDFYAVTSKKDTIACSGVTFERNYKIAPYQRVMLFFSNIDPNEKIQLVYNDHLFRKGIMKFKFIDNYKLVL